MRDFLKRNRSQAKLKFTADEMQAFDRDGWRCHYCGDGAPLTTDHIIPRVFGGSHDASNLVCACRSCNASRGVKPYSDFKEDVRADLICFALSGMAVW